MMKSKFGFRLLDERKIEEVGGIGSLWEHEKSGAQLFHIGCEDDNKVFSISFRTPPPDDTGLPHILEHSVLCGSRKFPLKEPFVELVKGSLNTFLNAMTFPDKTMYPVASRNNQDFKNLVDVYLDAVFFPNIYNNPWTLKQEGWHYELEDLDAPLSYNGVVYNEMKGVFSSPESVLEQKMFSVLFPDTPYGKESGGDPGAIPELTQKQFEEFHQDYYHPSNSYIYLYGDMDIDEYLAFFDQEYLNRFERKEIDSRIPTQRAFAEPQEEVVDYSLPQGESTEEKAIMVLSWVMEVKPDLTLTMGLDLLCHILLETSASPLKKALQDAGIGKEISGDFQSSLLQPVFSVEATFVDESQKEEFQRIVFETLQNLVNNGLDAKLIKASLHRQEFSLREGVTGSTPKGLIYGIRIMNSWLYDGHPAEPLMYEGALQTLKEGATNGYFENLIQKYLLNNLHQALIIGRPNPGLSDKKEHEIAQALSEWKSRQSEEILFKIIDETKELHLRQNTPDLEENLNSIPLLRREDLNEEPTFPEWQEQELDSGIIRLNQTLFTNHILYFSLLFNAKTIPQDDIFYLHLLSVILGRMDTENYTYEALSNEVNSTSGGLSISLNCWGDRENADIYHPKFIIKTKALTGDIERLVKLIEEIALRSQFNDEKRLKELIAESRARMENSISSAGQEIAVGRLNANLSSQGAYNYLGQLPFYQFIRKLDDDFEDEKEKIIERLSRVYKIIFSKDQLIINQVGDKGENEIFEKALFEFLSCLSDEKYPDRDYSFAKLPRTEGIYAGSKVQYVAQGFNFRALGKENNGFYKVVETILKYDYLWNRIRVQGGAYGATIRFERNGNTVFSSYRDPKLRETLEVYQELASYLKSFSPDEREMTKYVIGTIGNLDISLTPSMKADFVVAAYLMGIMVEDVRKERHEILNVKAESIREIAEWMGRGIAEGNYCVFGGEEKIKKEAAIFEQIISANGGK